MLFHPIGVAASRRGVWGAQGPVIVPRGKGRGPVIFQGHVGLKQNRVIQEGARAREEDARPHPGWFLRAIVGGQLGRPDGAICSSNPARSLDHPSGVGLPQVCEPAGGVRREPVARDVPGR